MRTLITCRPLLSPSGTFVRAPPLCPADRLPHSFERRPGSLRARLATGLPFSPQRVGIHPPYLINVGRKRICQELVVTYEEFASWKIENTSFRPPPGTQLSSPSL